MFQYVGTTAEFWNIFLDDRVESLDIIHINDQVCQITYNFKDEFVEKIYETNVYIAGITTTHARLKIYAECLGPLGRRSAYCDTDSIKYPVNDVNKPLSYNDNLGGLKDELDGEHITEFIASGPKSDAHKSSTGEITTHIKGFTLNVANVEKLSFDNMCKIIDGRLKSIVVTNPDHFTRSRKEKGVRLQELKKEFNINFDKRVVQSDLTTLPYGY